MPSYQQKVDHLQENCPVRAALDVVRGRWKPAILFELKDGVKRFSEISNALKGAAPQVLTMQLRQLEADGVISRAVFAEVPPRVEYQLTAVGEELRSVMDQLDSWGTDYLRRRRHSQKGEQATILR
ncbi:MAG: helix-turn-helix domain-containing protein [Opitutaceae bacterium]|nr:helix-turn-helix domain-containing protein [Opitutaceae bacterium]